MTQLQASQDLDSSTGSVSDLPAGEFLTPKIPTELPDWLFKLIPFPRVKLEVDGVSMSVVYSEPKGCDANTPTVVLLHGNPTWSFYYRNLIKSLIPNYRVIAPDMLGCGLSGKTDRTFSARDRMDHLEEVFKALKIERYSLVLHDWGGPIATGFAVRNPDKIDSITYLNTTLTEIDSLPWIIRSAAIPGVGRVITQLTTRFLKLTTEFGVVGTLPARIKKGYMYPYNNIASRKAIWDFVADIPFTEKHKTFTTLNELATKLPSLANVPIKIIWGLKDPCFHKEMLSKVSSHFPHAEVHEFADASHLVLEDKSEESVELISDFLGKIYSYREEESKLENSELLNKDEELDGSNEKISNKSSFWVPDYSISKAEENPSFFVSKFLESVSKDPSGIAVVEPVRNLTGLSFVSKTWNEISRMFWTYYRGLSYQGLKRGDKVLFLVPAGAEFLSLVYATMATGAIPVFVDPGVGRENLLKCVESIEPDAFISVPKGKFLKAIAKDSFKKCRFHLTVSNWSLLSEKTTGFLKRFSSLPKELKNSSGVSLIACTSGATGTPKGVVYNEYMADSLIKVIEDTIGVKPGGVDMPLLPIFSLFNLAHGVTTVIPPIDAGKPLALEPGEVVDTIKKCQVTSSFGSPTLWLKIAEYCARSATKLPNLQRVLVAGAPVPNRLLEVLENVIPLENVFTPYGATESLPVTLLSCADRRNADIKKSENGEIGTLVGKPINEVTVRVVKSDIQPEAGDTALVECEPFEVGEILVSGGHVSPEYLNRPNATLNSKVRIESHFSDGEGSFFHRMGDLGYKDLDGNIYFCGRKVHRVVTKEKVFHSVPVETYFNTYKKIKRSALVGVNTKGQVKPTLVVETYSEYFPTNSAKKEAFIKDLVELSDQDEVTRGIYRFEFMRTLPVDGRHNAKILRGKIATMLSDS